MISLKLQKDAYASRARVSPNHARQILNADLDYQKAAAFVVSNKMYDSTSLLRRATPLQQTVDAKRFEGVRISQDLADQIGLASETGTLKIYDIDNEVEFDVIVDKSLHAKNFMLPRNLMQRFLLSDNINIKLVEEDK